MSAARERRSLPDGTRRSMLLKYTWHSSRKRSESRYKPERSLPAHMKTHSTAVWSN